MHTCPTTVALVSLMLPSQHHARILLIGKCFRPAAHAAFRRIQRQTLPTQLREDPKKRLFIIMRFSPTPWLVATLAFVILGFTRGLHSSFVVFYVALLDTFGWSRGGTAGVFSVVLAVDAILSPVVGYLLDRFGTKAIVSNGCLILALGLLLSSVIGSLWQLYIFFGLISAIGITFTGMVPHVFLVSEWFVANRASAIGF